MLTFFGYYFHAKVKEIDALAPEILMIKKSNNLTG